MALTRTRGAAVGGHEPGHVRQRGLGGAVRHEATVAETTHRRADVDDRTPLAGEQVGERGFGQRERCGHVEVEGLLESADRRVEQRGRHAAARVVHDDVDAPELGDRGVDEPFDVVEVIDVAGDDEGLTAERPNLGGDRFELFGRPGGQRDVRAGFGQGSGRAGTDPPSGSGHDRGAAVESETVEQHGAAR
jgi:hypothetical protein